LLKGAACVRSVEGFEEGSRSVEEWVKELMENGRRYDELDRRAEVEAATKSHAPA
jgi:hypothetical protein